MSMDVMRCVAAASMDLSAAKLAQDCSVAVTKKVMETQALAGQELLRMLPGKGGVIDVYA